MKTITATPIVDLLSGMRTYLLCIWFLFGFIFAISAFMVILSLSDIALLQETDQIVKAQQEKDAKFLLNAAELDIREMQLGQLAQKKANSTDVKDLGRRIEAKHIESYSQLKSLAKEKLISLPTITTKKDQAVYDRLMKKTSPRFDKAYCNMMYEEHVEAIALFEKAYEDSADPEIRAMAEATLPELKSQLGFAAMCQKVFEEQ